MYNVTLKAKTKVAYIFSLIFDVSKSAHMSKFFMNIRFDRFFKMSSAKLTSPAAERNKVVIGDIIAKYVSEEPEKGMRYNAVEVAAGYGSHIMYNSERFPNVKWVVTEKDPACNNSIVAHLNSEATVRKNVHGPIIFDLSQNTNNWPKEIKELRGKVDIMLSVNLLHITAWKNVQALFSVASKLLKQNGEGKLLTYGPFAFEGVLTPDSNVQFDKHLKLNNSDWGIRDVSDLETEASREGDMVLVDVHDMPANNKTLVWCIAPSK